MRAETIDIYTACKKLVIGRVDPSMEDIASRQLSLMIAKTFSEMEYEWHGVIVGTFYDNYIIPELEKLPQ